MKTGFMATVKQGRNVLLAVLCSLLLPLILLAALGLAVHRIFIEWQYIRKRLLSGGVTCGINNDCPPGYECVGGRCIPCISGLDGCK